MKKDSEDIVMTTEGLGEGFQLLERMCYEYGMAYGEALKETIYDLVEKGLLPPDKVDAVLAEIRNPDRLQR
jgi:hypothetical protein